MKKIICLAIALVLCLSLLPMSVFAAASSAQVTGPDTVWAGDTITVAFQVSGTDIYAVNGKLSYDSNQVTLISTSQAIGSDWAVELNGDNFLAVDNSLLNPIYGNAKLFTATFAVKEDLEVGTKITISCKDVACSDGKADTAVNTTAYTVRLAAPLSTDNTLTSLTVNKGTLKPAFAPETTSYKLSVPYSVSKLEVDAVGADKATVTVNSPTLRPNATTKVTITVKAENGDTKTYTIAVWRAQDPSYVASSNNNLKDIQVNGFPLSPVFAPEVTEYVIWLPYETEAVTVKPSTDDSKATYEIYGGSELVAGEDNEITVVCTAEDGKQKTYTIIAKRAAAHDQTDDPTVPSDPIIGETKPTEPAATEPALTDPAPTQPAPAAPNSDNSITCNCTPIWLIALIAAICLIAGFAIGLLVGKKKKV
jgi:hypothetical protein